MCAMLALKNFNDKVVIEIWAKKVFVRANIFIKPLALQSKEYFLTQKSLNLFVSKKMIVLTYCNNLLKRHKTLTYITFVYYIQYKSETRLTSDL